jgi:hypothetical protein
VGKNISLSVWLACHRILAAAAYLANAADLNDLVMQGRSATLQAPAAKRWAAGVRTIRQQTHWGKLKRDEQKEPAKCQAPERFTQPSLRSDTNPEGDA